MKLLVLGFYADVNAKGGLELCSGCVRTALSTFTCFGRCGSEMLSNDTT